MIDFYLALTFFALGGICGWLAGVAWARRGSRNDETPF